VLCFFLALSSLSHAQRRAVDPEQAARDKAAREHYQQGILHYDLGEIDQSIAEFKQAYSISAAPGLLFNIAQAYRYKKDYEQALHFYRTYLRLQPRAINRREVGERVAELERLVEQSQQAQKAPPSGILGPGEKGAEEREPSGEQPSTLAPATAAPSVSAPTIAPVITPAPTAPLAVTAPAVDRSLHAFIKTPTGRASIAVGTLGAAALLSAAIVGGTVLSARADYAQGCDAGHCDDALYDSAHTRAVATDVLLGIGAAAVITSVALLVVRPGLRAHAAAAPVRRVAQGLAVSF
jgi:tetratricopeptide (TPR) repeat protein